MSNIDEDVWGDMRDEVLGPLFNGNRRFRLAYATDRESVLTIYEIAKRHIQPHWINMKNTDPLKRDLCIACVQDITEKYMAQRKREAKSILGAILLGVVVNLIVKAIMGFIT